MEHPMTNQFIEVTLITPNHGRRIVNLASIVMIFEDDPVIIYLSHKTTTRGGGLFC